MRSAPWQYFDNGSGIEWLNRVNPKPILLGHTMRGSITIHLQTDREQWLTPQVADRRFASVEEAVAQAIEGLRLDAEDDLGWVKPHLAHDETSISKGEVISGHVVMAELNQRIDALRGQ